MNSALNIIRNEHRSLAAILQALRALVERIRDGSSRPDFDGLRTMLYYVDAFSSRLHHPQEEEFLFQPLRARGGEAVAIVDDLEKSYPGIKERICDETGKVRRFVNVYVNGDDIRFLQNLETALKEGDNISIVPAIAGGL